MAVADVLITRFEADASGYVRGSNQAIGATRNFGGAITGVAIPAVTAFVTALGAIATAYVTFGVAASRRAADFDALVRSLEAIEGSGKKAKDTLKELSEIAKLPGLGLEEALQGYTNLRRNRVSEEDSFRLLNAAGNANALAGGGRDELQRILRAFSQIATNGAILGEELNQLAEAGIAAKAMLKDRFGTADGGQLARMGVTGEDGIRALIEEMEKLPKAMGGAKNSLENLAMAADMAVVGVGTGLNKVLIPEIEQLGGSIEKLNENGALETLGGVVGDLALTAFPELSSGSDALYDQFIEIGAVVADVAQALVNFKLNLQSIGKMAENGPWGPHNKLNPLNWFRGDDGAGNVFGAGPGVKSAGQNFKDEAAARRSLREAERKKSEDDAAKAAATIEEAAKPGDEQANKHLLAIEKHTKTMADGFNNFFGTSSSGSNFVNARNLGAINGSTALDAQQRMFAVVSGISALGSAQIARRR